MLDLKNTSGSQVHFSQLIRSQGHASIEAIRGKSLQLRFNPAITRQLRYDEVLTVRQLLRLMRRGELGTPGIKNLLLLVNGHETTLGIGFGTIHKGATRLDKASLRRLARQYEVKILVERRMPNG